MKKTTIDQLMKNDQFTIVGQGQKKVYQFFEHCTINGFEGVVYYDNNGQKTKMKICKDLNTKVTLIEKNN